MDNAHDQPLPPALTSLPNYSTNPAPYLPPQHFDYAARPQYHSSNTGNHVFPLSYSNSTFTSTTHSHCSYPHNGASNGYAPQWSGHIPITFIMAMLLNWVQYNIMVPTTRFLRIS